MAAQPYTYTAADGTTHTYGVVAKTSTASRIATAFSRTAVILLGGLAVLILTVHTPATPAVTPSHPSVAASASHVVPCDWYLSHGAMVANADANIQGPTSSFCLVPANEA